MKQYFQYNYNDRLGTCSDTIKQSGCLVTCLAMIDGRTPPEINNLLRDNGGYSNGCLVISQKAAQILGLGYNGTTNTKPNVVSIAETNYYSKYGVPQHFFILFPDGTQWDPLGKNIKYPIIKYHLFSKGESMDEKQIIRNYESSPQSLRFRGDADDVVFVFRKADNQDISVKKIASSSVNPEYLAGEATKWYNKYLETQKEITRLANLDITNNKTIVDYKKKNEDLLLAFDGATEHINELEKEIKELQKNVYPAETLKDKWNKVWNWIKSLWDEISDIRK